MCVLLFSILILSIGNAAPLQPRDLNTDRDAFTPSAFTIRPGVALNEMSHVYIENRDGNPTNNYPEYIFRLGANDIFEWRLGVTLVGLGEGAHVAIACPSLTCELAVRSFERELRDSAV